MLNFTQEEVERELSDKLPHGRRTDIARASGIAESTIKRQFNADDHEATSCAFRLLQIQCAYDSIDPQEAEEFWQTLVKFRELSKPPQNSPIACLNAETGKLNKEIGEFIAAKLENKPFVIQMKELLDAERQLEKTKQTLIAEKNRLNETPRNTSINVREFIAGVIKEKR